MLVVCYVCLYTVHITYNTVACISHADVRTMMRDAGRLEVSFLITWPWLMVSTNASSQCFSTRELTIKGGCASYSGASTF
jgi:hypothetical protein